MPPIHLYHLSIGNMKKGLILFKSRYGTTAQYTHWLSSELHLPSMDIDNATAQSLSEYEFLVIGSPVYYGKLSVSSFLRKHRDLLKTKKLFLFIVCATPDSSDKQQEKILTDNIPKALWTWDNVFFLPGRLIPAKLDLVDRFILRIATLFEKDSSRKKLMSEGIDNISKDNLIDLFLAVKIHTLHKKSDHN
jgi:menaquinone-dependent protoporphyrinogen IX oxidase